MKKSFLIGLCLLLSLALSGMALGQGRGRGGPPGGGPGGGQGGMQGRQKPPQEALDACKEKKSGDSCTYKVAKKTISGTCFTPRNDLPLACRPKNP